MIIFNEVLNMDTINTVCEYLINGYVVLVKTDTQWGLMSINPNLLYQIKKRPLEKKIVRLVGPNFKFGNLSEPQKMFIREFWPGPVTIVLDGEAYRLTNKKFINAILLTLGRMVYCTSANISGCEPINSIQEALIVFSHAIDNIVMIAPLNEDLSQDQNNLDKLPPLPSTIVDIDYWYIIRKGSKYLEVLSFIANKIIPYYEQQKQANRNEINKMIEAVQIDDLIEYEKVPVIDLVSGVTSKVKKRRQKQIYDEVEEQNIDHTDSNKK